MKKYLHYWIIVLTGFSLLMLLSVSQAQEQPVFRIGVLDDERGSISNGARLAVREINEAGGVRGAEGTLFRLELVIQSTETGDSLLNAIEAIDQARVIAVLGPETTEEVLSNLPLLQSLNVPILTPAIGDTVVASDSTGRIFRIRAAERWQGSALADYLANILNVQEVTTIQLDRNSTASRVGFSIALSELPNPPAENTLLLDTNMQLIDLVSEIINSGSQVAAVYGPPELASQFLTQLRAAGWVGQFAYHQALDPIFRNTTSLEELRGVLSTTTWSLNVRDVLSDTFVDSYTRAYEEAPGAIEAASYDAINMLSQAIGQPGDLRSNLGLIRDVPGVQGTLNPSGLAAGEMSDTIAIVQLNAFGGADLISRYAGVTQVIGGGVVPPPAESSPTPTATLDGVIITIDSTVQNVRTGPGTEYEVLGQLRQGEQARVIGATVDFSWVVIDFRGQQGWLASYLLEIVGDRNSVPVIAPPPTPTPLPATVTPTSSPSPDIVIVSASPSNITLGVSTNINVTVRNAGSTNAGPFAIAASFSPDNYFTSFNIGGLAAQTDVIVQLPVVLSGATGRYQAVIVADLNNEVNEGQGEANNDDFILNYTIDRQLILINNTTLGSGATVDLEGNVTPVVDIQYTGAGLNSANTCTGTAYCIGVLSPNVIWDTATYDTVNGSNGINTTFISNAALTVGTTIGVLTGEGRRAILRVDAINPGVSITLTYRVYQ